MTTKTKTTWTHSSASDLLKASHPKLNAVNDYILGVIDRTIVTGELVRLAVLRHLNDLEKGHLRGLRFDQPAASRVIDLWPKIFNLEDGDGVRPFELEPWQQFITASLFGWMDSENCRRFRTAYIEIGKGNGKSPLAAGFCLYGLVADHERAAEIYCCANKKEQAKILFTDAVRMVENSPWLKQRLQINRDNIFYPKLNSFFRVISSETKGLDGPRPHIFVADEVHEMVSATLINKLSAGFKGRRNPLGVEITNSGQDTNSICFQHHEFSEKILRDLAEDDTWFGFVCTLDPCKKCRAEGYYQPNPSCAKCDDWRNEAVWQKANPNLGISIQPKYLRKQVDRAAGISSEQNIVKRLNFCIWVQQSKRWIGIEKWDECNAWNDPPQPMFPIIGLQNEFGLAVGGQRCYGHIDLSSKLDLTAFALDFPDTGRMLVWYWCPEENVTARVKNDRVEYDRWIEKGFIKATPGNVVDYDTIRDDINEIGKIFNIEEIGFDEWNALQLGNQLLEDGFSMIAMRQNISTLNGPMKEAEMMIVGNMMEHDGNPVTRWCVSNLVPFTDRGGNVRPDKEKSREKIDGGVAWINAKGRTMANCGSRGSVYENRGVVTV
jgi:phage terminase large subunit-like protein